MSDPAGQLPVWGDDRHGGACVLLADDAPLGKTGGGEAPDSLSATGTAQSKTLSGTGADGGGGPDVGPMSTGLPERLAAAALAVTQERLGRGRWVSRLRVADDRAARELVAQLRADGRAAVLGPPDEAHAVGGLNRNRAVRIGNDLGVCFPWVEAEAPTVVEIDPGGAFGAGTHPSTRLLAEWLAEHIVGGERVLDVGCGSGVLALVAARLGAAEAVGINIESAATSAAEANARRNGLDGLTAFGTAAVGEPDLGTFDVVVANITADVLIALAGDIAARVGPDGRLALSGISAAQASTVAAAYRRHGIELTDPVRRDDGVSLVGRRVILAGAA